jgi:hypothetical protein
VKITTRTARRLLREANPAPDDAFADAARDPEGRLTVIFGRASSDIIAFDTPEGASIPADRRRWRPEVPRLRWWTAIPTAVLTAALAATLAVVLLVTGSPAPGHSPGTDQAASGALVELVANLTAHPAADQGDASAVLRALADVAAAQPAPPALGPVEYSRAESWGLDLGTTHYGLSYRSHQTNLEEDWAGSDGASLSVRTWPGGKVPEGNIPVGRSGPSARGAANFAWYNPATLPTSESLMRQHLLDMPGFSDKPVPVIEGSGSVTESGNGKITFQGPGKVVYQPPDLTSQIVTGAEILMGSEPLPPGARAALLRVLASTAAHPGSGRAFYDLGSVTDRAGHKAVAIAYEQQQNMTSALGTSPGVSCTITTSPGRTTETCSGSASGSGSGTSGSAPATSSPTSRRPGNPSPTPGSTSASLSAKVTHASSPPSSSTSEGGSAGHLPTDFMESSLTVLVFDPDTGALLGEEYAYCNAPVQAHLATGKCFATSYDQFLEIKAVPSIPATPTAAPDTPPSGPVHTLPTNTDLPTDTPDTLPTNTP